MHGRPYPRFLVPCLTSLYDGPNRPTKVQYTDGSSTTYTYDLANPLTQAVDTISGTITFSYDNLDRLTQETTPQGTISYTYDAASRRTSMTVAGQPAVNYTYDNADRLTQIAQGSSTVSFGYDDAGRRTSVTLPNGVTATLGYDAASQLTSILYKLGTTLLGDLTYTYDAGGNRTQLGGTLARTALPAAVATASYDAANQLTQWGAASLTYDANGNLTSDGASSYTWDARDQLASISGAASASFQYDGFGRRKARTVAGTTLQFLYDGAQAVQEQSGGTPSANLLTGLGMDDVFLRTDAAGSRTFVSDALGSTVALLDATGAVQTQYTYGPFGATTASGPTSTNSVQYTGRENDSTGSYY